MMQVNRYLKDKHFDRIDHALGRPSDPLGETYREHYCACAADASLFRGSVHWEEGRTINKGKSVYFYVTAAGRAALKEHLREIGDKHRLYTVSLDGEDLSPRAATSRAKARYDAWLSASDVMDITFGDFQKRSRVRLSQ